MEEKKFDLKSFCLAHKYDIAIGLIVILMLSVVYVVFNHNTKVDAENASIAENLNPMEGDFIASDKAGEDVKFTENTEYGTAQDGDIIIEANNKPVENSNNASAPSEDGTTQPVSTGNTLTTDNYVAVYTDKYESSAPPAPTTPSADDKKDETGKTENDKGEIKPSNPSNPQKPNNNGNIIVENVTDISDKIWSDNQKNSFNNFTYPTENADGSIGTLKIDSIGLTVNSYLSEPDKMEDEARGVAHFANTSSWDGNIGLSGHNWTPSGDAAFFKDLHKVKVGDKMTYTTPNGTRTYKITTKETIAANDWSYLGRTDDNRLTLITCNSDGTKRIVVQGEQV